MPNPTKALASCLAAASLAACTQPHVSYLSLRQDWPAVAPKKGDIQHPMVGIGKKSLMWTGADLALTLSTPHVPGTAPVGLDIAVGSAMFLLPSGGPATTPEALAAWHSHVEAWMPAGMAADEGEAQLKMSALLEQAAAAALPQGYRAEPHEYSNQALFGAVDTYRELRVEGPGCGALGCILYGPFQSRSGSAAKHDMVKLDQPKTPWLDGRFAYTTSGTGSIGLSKLTEEHVEEGSVSGHWLRRKLTKLDGFDYDRFYLALSANLPDWVYYYEAGGQGSHLAWAAFYHAGARLDLKP